MFSRSHFFKWKSFASMEFWKCRCWSVWTEPFYQLMEGLILWRCQMQWRCRQISSKPARCSWHHQNSLSATQGLLCWHWYHQNVLGATGIIKMVSAPHRDCFDEANIIKTLLVQLASSNWSRRHTETALMTLGPLHGGTSLKN